MRARDPSSIRPLHQSPYSPRVERESLWDAYERAGIPGMESSCGWGRGEMVGSKATGAAYPSISQPLSATWSRRADRFIAPVHAISPLGQGVFAQLRFPFVDPNPARSAFSAIARPRPIPPVAGSSPPRPPAPHPSRDGARERSPASPARAAAAGAAERPGSSSRVCENGPDSAGRGESGIGPFQIPGTRGERTLAVA